MKMAPKKSQIRKIRKLNQSQRLKVKRKFVADIPEKPLKGETKSAGPPKKITEKSCAKKPTDSLGNSLLL